MDNLIRLSQKLMITLRFFYIINNFRDIHFNYNIEINITSGYEIFTMNEKLKGTRGHKK